MSPEDFKVIAKLLGYLLYPAATGAEVAPSRSRFTRRVLPVGIVEVMGDPGAGKTSSLESLRNAANDFHLEVFLELEALALLGVSQKDSIAKLRDNKNRTPVEQCFYDVILTQVKLLAFEKGILKIAQIAEQVPMRDIIEQGRGVMGVFERGPYDARVDARRIKKQAAKLQSWEERARFEGYAHSIKSLAEFLSQFVDGLAIYTSSLKSSRKRRRNKGETSQGQFVNSDHMTTYDQGQPVLGNRSESMVEFFLQDLVPELRSGSGLIIFNNLLSRRRKSQGLVYFCDHVASAAYLWHNPFPSLSQDLKR